MKHILATLLLMLASAFAFAGALDSQSARDAGFDELSQTEKADLIKQIADKKAAKSQAANAVKVVEQTTPAKVNDWLDIGSRIGAGMAGAAREMGVAVNDFAKTPVGIWTIALITWKFVGSVAVHVIGGLLIWLVGFTFIWWVSRRYRRETIVYDKEKTDIFGRSRLVSVARGDVDDEVYVSQIIMAFFVLLAGIATMFSY